jgi:hypothetical protein
MTSVTAVLACTYGTDENPVTHWRSNSTRGQVTVAILKVSFNYYVGCLKGGLRGGVRNVSPSVAGWQGLGVGFTSVHEYTRPITTSLPFSISISIISFVLGTANLVESGGQVLGDRCNYINTK